MGYTVAMGYHVSVSQRAEKEEIIIVLVFWFQSQKRKERLQVTRDGSLKLLLLQVLPPKIICYREDLDQRD